MARIYLVEDHAIVRDGLHAMLVAGGHAVVGATGDLALALRELVQLAPDVLLLDLSLGPHSGFELLADLQVRQLPVRAIVLTMSIDPRDTAQALHLGAAGYLPKHVASAELMQAIERVAAGESVFPRGLDATAAGSAQGTGPGALPADALARLSPRERQILAMVVKGRTSASIAQQVGLSPKTIETYRSRLMAKLDVADVTGLVRLAVRAGLIDADPS